MAMLPPPTLTATVTATPRNTATPVPSFTPAGPYLYPTASPILQYQYYRVKHDDQLALYNYKSRTFDDNSEGLRKQTPEVVPLLVAPKEGVGTDRTIVGGAWELFINAINDNDATPTLAIGDVRVGEGNSGTTSAVFVASPAGAFSHVWSSKSGAIQSCGARAVL